ncbi:uncharacterized protein LOC126895704 [Daktulosphaira vitifoliae]|uniref:uncharacterized protein LOC126895704 n=1 Tax=Daktulosphaira vitifoliae TaxID=58002 RepID=UPI0021AA203C|nr:uncharacterized protein LOC126895704 [Daktulosphaira vitifoliae]
MEKLDDKLFDKKISELESTLKKLEEELFLETITLKNIKDSTKTKNIAKEESEPILSVSNDKQKMYNAQMTYVKNIKASEKNLENTGNFKMSNNDCIVQHFKEPESVYYVNNKPNDKVIIRNTETQLKYTPHCLEFQVANGVNGTSFEERLKISNPSKAIILCRYSHLFDPHDILKNYKNIIMVNLSLLTDSVETNIIHRLRPGVTVDYEVRFNPVELPNSINCSRLEGLKLAFETVKNNQLDVKYVFYVPLKFCTARPKPEVVTKIIT